MEMSDKDRRSPDLELWRRFFDIKPQEDFGPEVIVKQSPNQAVAFCSACHKSIKIAFGLETLKKDLDLFIANHGNCQKILVQ